METTAEMSDSVQQSRGRLKYSPCKAYLSSFSGAISEGRRFVDAMQLSSDFPIYEICIVSGLEDKRRDSDGNISQGCS